MALSAAEALFLSVCAEVQMVREDGAEEKYLQEVGLGYMDVSRT